MRIEDYFENFPILETDRILLRPITYLDIEDMYEYCSVPEVSRYTTWEYHKSKRMIRRDLLILFLTDMHQRKSVHGGLNIKNLRKRS